MGEERNNFWYIFFGTIILILIIIIVVNAPKIKQCEPITQQIQPMTGNDFKILNANWDTFQMKFNGSSLIVNTPQVEHNWNLICNCSEKPCTTSNWHITVQASEDLVCDTFIDGNDDRNNIDTGSGQIIEKGLRKTTFVEDRTSDNIYTNFDVTKEHEIMVCCISENRNKVGTICDSVILPAKC
ncbi:MAG: hypothetical protein NTZ83_04505 [Candidatus Pacearchaeota archaeon]|nr:hypothetical protein [Candidatus Pacearchaeota archaeon]